MGEQFPKWRADVANSQVVHIKGFGSGIGNFYNDDVLALLKDCELLVWDGDDYEATGFTQVVPQFLKLKPSAKAVGFKLNYEVDIFKESWASVVEDFPERIAVVPVDLVPPDWKDAVPCGVADEMKKVGDLPLWAQEYFLLGRVACKFTGSKLVISLGGGGISAKEALAGIDDGMEWRIFALSRGRAEQHPTILNFAAAEPRAKLITGKDPNESEAFAPHPVNISNEGGSGFKFATTLLANTPVRELELSALGDALHMAADVALRLEKEKFAHIVQVQTMWEELKGGRCRPKLSIHVKKSSCL